MDAEAPRRCSVEDFSKTPSEHIVVDLPRPFQVRAVQGVIRSQAGDWPEGTVVAFELRSVRGKARSRRVLTDKEGRFEVAGMSPGEYCFKASVEGWQSVLGKVVVAEDAEPSATVSFEMPLGL